MLNMAFAMLAPVLSVALFFGMLLFLELGRRLSLHQLEKKGAATKTGVGAVDGVVYSLLGLLIGFTFSGAAARCDHRRELVAEQVTAIGIAWQRIDALPALVQPAIRDGFRRYVDAVIAAYKQPPRKGELFRESPAVAREQDDIWTRSVAACLAPDGEKARMLLLPALNEMFGKVERERLARRMHPPSIIFIMLAVTAFAASVFAGYSMAGSARNWMYVIGVAATISVAAYVILELEYPRLGAVRVSSIDETLVELRGTMK